MDTIKRIIQRIPDDHDREILQAEFDRKTRALERIGQCGAGHVCCNVNFSIAQTALKNDQP